MYRHLTNAAIGINMYWNEFRLRAPLLNATENVEASQLKLLKAILYKNANTAFGREHDFLSIGTVEEYRAKVPIQTHETLESYINRQIQGELALTTDIPKYYARTSGTTGAHKDIPLTKKGLLQVKTAQKQLALSLWRDTDFMTGSILGFASTADEGTLINGCHYGSVSGTSYQSLSHIIEQKFVVPQSVFGIKDIQAKYQAYALAVLANDNLTGIVAANPSSVLKLVLIIEEHSAELMKALQADPTKWLLPDALAVLPDILNRVSKRRLKQLSTTVAQHSGLTLATACPVLSTIATWTGGSCGIALNQLKAHLADDVRIVEYGYGASEFMGSVNVDALNNLCLPQLNQHVYEFVSRELWEADKPEFLGPQNLESGKDYYVFVTTQSGLYRYNINDIVRAGNKVGNCATLSFLQKGRGVTNITGEKLSEYQLISAVSEALADSKSGGYMGLANEEESRYDIYIELDQTSDLERLSNTIDSLLCDSNIEYNDKRASGRLNTVRLYPLKRNACDKLKQLCVERGVREVQYKPTVLDYSRHWIDAIQPLLAQAQ